MIKVEKAFFILAVLLLSVACTGESYYVKQTRIYKEAIESVRSASTSEELDLINKALSDKLRTLENESQDVDANDENAYAAELEELIRLQREYLNAAYNKRYDLVKNNSN